MSTDGKSVVLTGLHPCLFVRKRRQPLLLLHIHKYRGSTHANTIISDVRQQQNRDTRSPVHQVNAYLGVTRYREMQYKLGPK